ncbi:sigma-54-dependent transcriptional regulator [Blastopirellula marina]|uniref:DNA-binding transcriptional regulator NtrC n=1 Tax=Blastopirellula marina TaxID=124 RepID=A0A2S8GBQ1_9BACT|nr:sigma-54 dependent transcriptional regulator [Blastopirellula marina]PQO41882.1 Fis family transcriptional regulator [Blastopirellula marina]PTL46240.1 sigma-54-dependent Fis family transcriptional regulator [Blastopirellula marina]
MIKLLVVDDEQLILDCFLYGFTPPDYQIIVAKTAQEALELFPRERPDVVLLDVRLPDMSGLELFAKLNEADSRTPIILMTGHGTAGTAIEAMRSGAFDYILKPLDVDQLAVLIDSAAETSRMMRTPARLPSDGPTEMETDLLVGQCDAMQEVYRSIGRVARQNVTALILGESGTGKEVVARAIYHYSKRSQQRFLAINCAAIPEQLLESELFGHEKGAFTGADHRKIGKFELASNGTLFLDEIGDMTPLMQTKILRVLQDQTFERVGGDETIRTNARIIAATNRDLQEAIREGSFRSDLYYRLNVYTIHLPPLRERVEDIPLLVDHFLKKYGSQLERPMTAVAPETMDVLSRYAWPGNVRELQSAIQHALLEATGPVLVPAFLPASIREAPTSEDDEIDEVSEQESPEGDGNARLARKLLKADSYNILAEVVNRAEREAIVEVLQETECNLTTAARRLGISRTTLRTKLRTLKISLEHTAEAQEPG